MLRLDVVFNALKMTICEWEHAKNRCSLRTTQWNGTAHHRKRDIHEDICAKNDVFHIASCKQSLSLALVLEKWRQSLMLGNGSRSIHKATDPGISGCLDEAAVAVPLNRLESVRRTRRDG